MVLILLSEYDLWASLESLLCFLDVQIRDKDLKTVLWKDAFSWPQDGWENAQMQKNSVWGPFELGEANFASPFVSMNLELLISMENTFWVFYLHL